MPVERLEIKAEFDNTEVIQGLIKTEKNIIEWIKRVEKKGKIRFNFDFGDFSNLEKEAINKTKKSQEVFNKNKLKPILSLEEYKNKLLNAEVYARDTKKKLDTKILWDLKVNVAELEKKKEDIQKQMRELKKMGEDPITLRMEVKELSSKLREANRELLNFENTGNKSLSRFQASLNSIGSGFSSIMKGASIFSAFAGSATVAYNVLDNFALAYQSQESAFAGVQKTVNATDEEFKKMNDGLKNLAKQIPITYEELASIAEVGGQMGIAQEYLLDFTETVGKLGTAISGVSKEEAAQTLVRITEATGQGIGHVDELADALVSLGNNFKANEGQILDFSNRIFGAGALVGMTGEQIMAIGTANNVKIVTISFIAGFVGFFQNFQKNIGIITDNIGTGFDNIPYYLALALESAMNKAIQWANSITSLFKSIPFFGEKISGKLTIGQVNFTDGLKKGNYKSFDTTTNWGQETIEGSKQKIEIAKESINLKNLGTEMSMQDLYELGNTESEKITKQATNEVKKKIKKQMDEETARLVEELKNPKSGKGGGNGKGSGGKGKKEEYSEEIKAIKDRYKAELDEKFDSFFYEKGDFIEYIIFDEKNKKGLHKFSGFINGIERYFSIKDGQGLKLEIQGLVALLSEEKIEKSYNGNLYDCLNNFINDVNEIFILEGKMEFLGEKIFKNAIKNIEEAKKINVSITGENYFDILQKIFLGQEKSVNNRHFFVNQSGEIIFLEEIEKTNIFTINKDISEININNNGEIIINLINPTKKLQVGQKIILQNINKNLNLNGKFIRELAFGLSKVVINVGKVVNLGNLK